MMNFFSIETIFFTLWGYQMSYLEFFGTILNIWCVYLVMKNKVLSWPVGIVAVTLFMFLFYQIQLYSDLIEQIYYLVTGFIGWWVWTHPKKKEAEEETKELRVSRNEKGTNVKYAIVIAICSLALGWVMTSIHLWLPMIFTEPASLPYLDAFTTVMSFAATILQIKRKVEQWPIWILVDIIGVGLYYYKGVVFVSALYFIFLILATKGYFEWKKIYKNQEEAEK